MSIYGSDGYVRNFNLDEEVMGLYWTDSDGNSMMLAWRLENKSTPLKLIFGQSDPEHLNRPKWVEDIVKIVIKKEKTESGSGTKGKYEGSQDENKLTESPLTQTVTATVAASVQYSSGQAKAAVTASDITKALTEASGKAKDGEDVKKIIQVDAKVKEGGGDVSKAEVSLPADGLDALAKDENAVLVVNTDMGSFTLDRDLLTGLSGGSQPLVLVIEAAKTPENLSEDGKTRIGGRAVVDVKLMRGNKELTELGGKQLQVATGYEIEAGEIAHKLAAYYIDENGSAQVVKVSQYDQDGKQMKWKTTHLSLYGVGYHDVSFRDISSHWAKSSIEFLAARDVVNGKAEGVFDPEGDVTRAEFVKMLAESMDGIDVGGAKSAGFTDISSASWYGDYVNWAAGSGIIKGYTDGSFRPNAKITREQMAVMTKGFIDYMKVSLDTVNALTSFQDQDSISGYAASQVAEMQQKGIINGNPDGTFRPQGTATRAQAAAVISGFMEALLN